MMSKPRPRIVCLNGTCLDAVADLRDEIAARHVDLVADDHLRRLRPEDAEGVLEGTAGVILPGPLRGFPSADDYRRHPSLKVLSVAASGFDWLDVPTATRAGVVVTNVVGGIGAEVVADMTWALMLAVARQIPYHDRAVQAGSDERRLGVSLWRKTLGVVGLGHIGRAVVRRARGFDVKVLAASSHADPAFVAEHGIEVVPRDELLARSDIVSLHVRMSADKAGMIGRRELALMKPTAILINAARRELVDADALAEAILGGRLGGAGLDDPPARRDDPLLGLPSVVFTPHLGNRAIEGVRGVFLAALDNAIAVAEGHRPVNVVNPEVFAR